MLAHRGPKQMRTSMHPPHFHVLTSSGDATKQWVAGLPSLRAAKLRLKEVMMELASPCSTHSTGAG